MAFSEIFLHRLPSLLRDLRGGWRATVVFLFWFAVLDFVVFGPLVAWVLRHILRASGNVAVSNYDLTTFFLSPAGVLFLTVAVVMKLALLFTEMGGLTLIALATRRGHRIALAPLLWQSTSRLPQFARLGLLLLGVSVLVALPFAVGVLGLTHWLLGEADINYYLATRPPAWWQAVGGSGLIGLAGAAVWVGLLVRWVFAIPMVLNEGLRPVQALRSSWLQTRGRAFGILRSLSAWWCGLWLAFAALAWATQAPTEWLIRWAGLELSRLLPVILVALTLSGAGTVLWSCLAVNGHQWIITRLYLQSRPQPHTPLETAATPARRILPLRRLRWLTWSLLGLGLLGAAGGVALSLDRMPEEDRVAVTAHRGSSRQAPENTLAAIRQAIADGADYAEIDVQRTADGHLVVLHDGDLRRMAGDPRKLAELTLAELQQVDVGRQFSPAFRGERVPTLQQAMDLARGSIRLNLELKYNRPDAELAPALIACIREQGFADQCVITSLDYAALRAVEASAPELETGLIVTAVVGEVTRTEADFLSLKAAQATPALVSLAHRRGKDVHVWTVNTQRTMLEMLERGVDNIITDEPARLVRMIGARNELEPATRLALRLRTLWLPEVSPRQGNEL